MELLNQHGAASNSVIIMFPTVGAGRGNSTACVFWVSLALRQQGTSWSRRWVWGLVVRAPDPKVIIIRKNTSIHYPCDEDDS